MKREVALSGAVLLMAVAAAPASSRAEGATGLGDPRSAAAGDAGDARAQALTLFQRSLECYRRGDFAGAVGLLEQAHAAYPEPVLLYNLGRAYEGLGARERAAEEYRRYLRADPHAPDAAAIEQRILALTTVAPTPSNLVARDTGPPPPHPRARRGPWIMAASGVALAAIGGGTLWFMAERRHADAQRAADADLRDAAMSQQQQAQRLVTWTNAALIGGGVLAVFGVGWGVVARF